MELLKVMIVDDEIIFRQMLFTTIKWEAIGLEICCEAKNGLEALEKVKVFKPDIALVDINMPCMDGLVLSEKLKEDYAGMAIVLITGHSEFEYARKAVKLGVLDYILKPFNDEELIKVLIKSKSYVLKFKEEKAAKFNSKTVLKERLLNLLISNENSYSDEEIMEQFEHIDIRINASSFLVAAVEIDNMYRMWNDPGEIILWKNAVSNILGEILDNHKDCFVFNGPEGKIITILEWKDDRNTAVKPLDCFKKLCDYVSRYLHFTVTVGVGNFQTGFEGIRVSYMESLAALKNKLMLGNNRVIDYPDSVNEFSSIGFYSSETNEDVLISLRMHDWEKVRKKIDEIFLYIASNRLSTDYTYVICTGLISLCLSYIIETGNEISELFGDYFLPYTEMKNKESVEALHQWVLDLFAVTMGQCMEGKTTRSRKTVDLVKEYIHCNYSNSELCLEQIAEYFHMNSDYLRSIFRKEMGITIIEYITNVRMQKAKQLISSGSLKLSAVSDTVGFNDAGYFSKCFKKFFGISPSEYETKKVFNKLSLDIPAKVLAEEG